MKKILFVALFVALFVNTASAQTRFGIRAWWNKRSAQNFDLLVKVKGGSFLIRLQVVSTYYDFSRTEIKSRYVYLRDRNGLPTHPVGPYARWSKEGKIVERRSYSWKEKTKCNPKKQVRKKTCNKGCSGAPTSRPVKVVKKLGCQMAFWKRKAINEAVTQVSAQYDWGSAVKTVCRKATVRVIKR